MARELLPPPPWQASLELLLSALASGSSRQSRLQSWMLMLRSSARRSQTATRTRHCEPAVRALWDRFSSIATEAICVASALESPAWPAWLGNSCWPWTSCTLWVWSTETSNRRISCCTKLQISYSWRLLTSAPQQGAWCLRKFLFLARRHAKKVAVRCASLGCIFVQEPRAFLEWLPPGRAWDAIERAASIVPPVPQIWFGNEHLCPTPLTAGPPAPAAPIPACYGTPSYEAASSGYSNIGWNQSQNRGLPNYGNSGSGNT